MDLDEGEGVRVPSVNRFMRRLYKRALAGAAGAPQQDIVGREPRGEAFGVVEQNVADPVDPAQQLDLDPIDLVNRLQPTVVGVPYEGVALSDDTRTSPPICQRGESCCVTPTYATREIGVTAFARSRVAPRPSDCTIALMLDVGSTTSALLSCMEGVRR